MATTTLYALLGLLVIIGGLSLLFYYSNLKSGESVSKPETYMNDSIYTNKTYRYSIEVPENWVFTERPPRTLHDRYGEILNFVGFGPAGQTVLYQHALMVKQATLDEAVSDLIKSRTEKANDNLRDQNTENNVTTLRFYNRVDSTNVTEFYLIERGPWIYIFENHGAPDGTTPWGDIGYAMFQSLTIE